MNDGIHHQQGCQQGGAGLLVIDRTLLAFQSPGDWHPN